MTLPPVKFDPFLSLIATDRPHLRTTRLKGKTLAAACHDSRVAFFGLARAIDRTDVSMAKSTAAEAAQVPRWLISSQFVRTMQISL
jgi:hypothetical protein